MHSHESQKSVSTTESANAVFASAVCLPLLRDRQNEDGGWGFHPEAESRVEPTCWALLALMQVASTAADREILERGLHRGTRGEGWVLGHFAGLLGTSARGK